MPTKVTPGERIGMVGQYIASTGTYERNQNIHASIAGIVHETPGSFGGAPILTVQRTKLPSSIPDVDSIVTGKVTRVNPRMATLSIMVVGNTPCRETFQGVIRAQDVRATETDKVQIYKCFRPGDIVRARVISLGDARAYYCSTAANELGVIFAQSAAGHTMIPISWDQMVCPATKVVENRKCAKP
ncbi:Exosome complex component CSL4 [Irineochytrium annulatum]|nr:Exosome complex component CSL4 [Irineochytrium annulatum]